MVTTWETYSSRNRTFDTRGEERAVPCEMYPWPAEMVDISPAHRHSFRSVSPQLLHDWWSASFAALPPLITSSSVNSFRLSGSRHRMSGKPRFIFPALFHYATLPAPRMSDEWALFRGRFPPWLSSTKPHLACRGNHTSIGCLSHFSMQDSDGCAHEAIVRSCSGFVLGFHKLLWRWPKYNTSA